MPKPLIVAFGHEAQSGKDAVCEHLAKLYKGSNILVTAFAKRLRSEIHSEMHQIAADHYLSPREALEVMCRNAGVKFDPFAVRDKNNPHGKQRKLQQHWGTEFRRTQCATYWTDKVQEEIELKKPDLVLISDMRFLNEAEWVKSQGGQTVHVLRPGRAGLIGAEAEHVSEHQLSNYPFDFTLVNDGSLKQLHTRAAELYRNILNYKLFP